MGEDKKRHRPRRKTGGHNYAEGVGEIVGTKRADGEGVPGVSRRTTALGCPRTTGGESFEKGTINQRRNPMAQEFHGPNVSGEMGWHAAVASQELVVKLCRNFPSYLVKLKN